MFLPPDFDLAKYHVKSNSKKKTLVVLVDAENSQRIWRIISDILEVGFPTIHTGSRPCWCICSLQDFALAAVRFFSCTGNPYLAIDGQESCVEIVQSSFTQWNAH